MRDASHSPKSQCIFDEHLLFNLSNELSIGEEDLLPTNSDGNHKKEANYIQRKY